MIFNYSKYSKDVEEEEEEKEEEEEEKEETHIVPDARRLHLHVEPTFNSYCDCRKSQLELKASGALHRNDLAAVGCGLSVEHVLRLLHQKLLRIEHRDDERSLPVVIFCRTAFFPMLTRTPSGCLASP